MKIIAIVISFLISLGAQSQNTKGTNFYIKLETGCIGNCTFSSDDSCSKNKSKINVVNYTVEKTKKGYSNNSNSISQDTVNKLKMLLSDKNFKMLKNISIDAKNELKANFVPPAPACYFYEKYSIQMNGSAIVFTRIDHNGNLNGSFLRDEINEIINELNSLIIH